MFSQNMFFREYLSVICQEYDIVGKVSAVAESSNANNLMSVVLS